MIYYNKIKILKKKIITNLLTVLTNGNNIQQILLLEQKIEILILK